MMTMQDAPDANALATLFDAPSVGPSWDDFEPISRPAKLLDLCVHVKAGDRVTLSADLVHVLGWEKGQIVDVRAKDGRMALRISDAPYSRGKNYKLTNGSKSASLCVNCNASLQILGTSSGSYHAEAVEWGVIIRLDDLVKAKA